MPKRPYKAPALTSLPFWVAVAFGQTVFVFEHLCRQCGSLWSTAFYGAERVRPFVPECPRCDSRHVRTLTQDEAARASLEPPARRRVLAWLN